MLPPPPDALAMEPPRLGAPFGPPGSSPVLWERVRLSLSQIGNATAQQISVLLAKPSVGAGTSSLQRLPVVLLLHATGSSKEAMGAHMERFARLGFLAVAFDARYHGERAVPNAAVTDLDSLNLASLGPDLLRSLDAARGKRLQVYYSKLVEAWFSGGDGERPFLFDTVADALDVVSYISARPDVDPARIGATGVSLGGMHSWLLAAADERLAVIAPAIGVQSFSYAMRHELWGARAASIQPVFDAAAKDLGKSKVDTAVVAEVWRRLVPGLAEEVLSGRSFDAPESLRWIAPRPMLVLSGEKDPRCPIEGVKESLAAARVAYAELGAAKHLEHFFQEGVGHEMTAEMWRKIDAFFARTLLTPRARQ